MDLLCTETINGKHFEKRMKENEITTKQKYRDSNAINKIIHLWCYMLKCENLNFTFNCANFDVIAIQIKYFISSTYRNGTETINYDRCCECWFFFCSIFNLCGGTYTSSMGDTLCKRFVMKFIFTTTTTNKWNWRAIREPNTQNYVNLIKNLK